MTVSLKAVPILKRFKLYWQKANNWINWSIKFEREIYFKNLIHWFNHLSTEKTNYKRNTYWQSYQIFLETKLIPFKKKSFLKFQSNFFKVCSCLLLTLNQMKKERNIKIHWRLSHLKFWVTTFLTWLSRGNFYKNRTSNMSKKISIQL